MNGRFVIGNLFSAALGDGRKIKPKAKVGLVGGG